MTTALIIMAGIVSLALLVALLSKKEYAIERQIDIAASRQEAFDYIKFLKNQDNYSNWVMMDPGMQKSFQGNDGTEGFIYGWDGNKKAGAGEQEIKSIAAGKGIDIEIRFIRPFKGTAVTRLETGSIMMPGNKELGTTVKWIFSSRMSFPMNLILLFMNMDKILGKDLEMSLVRLKGILEMPARP